MKIDLTESISADKDITFKHLDVPADPQPKAQNIQKVLRSLTASSLAEGENNA